MVQIEVVDGKKSCSIDLQDGVFKIGRSRECAICLKLPYVSRWHAELRVKGDGLYVRDLGSLAGTSVDEHKLGAAEVEVEGYSHINIGGALLRRVRETEVLAPDQAGTQFLRPRAAAQQPQTPTPTAQKRLVRSWGSLLEMMATTGDAVTVGRAICEFVGQLFPADRVLVQSRLEGDALYELARWTRKLDGKGSHCFSQAVIDRVLHRRESVLVGTVPEDFGLRANESCRHLTSVMAAPLFDNHRVLGILYADTRQKSVHFTEHDLQVFTAVANVAAVKLREIQLWDDRHVAARLIELMRQRPLPAIEGYELSCYQVMCRDVGGDLLQCLPRRNGNYLLALGDVAGKGVPAALGMVASGAILRSLCPAVPQLKDLARQMNRQLFETFGDEDALTFFLADLIPAEGLLQFANSGHEPRIVRTSGRIEVLPPTSVPMGLTDTLDVGTAEARLGPGDLLAVCSDGVPDATINGTDFYDWERLDALLVRSRNTPLPALHDEIVRSIEEFVGDEGVSDDVTIMLLRRSAKA